MRAATTSPPSSTALARVRDMTAALDAAGRASCRGYARRRTGRRRGAGTIHPRQRLGPSCLLHLPDRPDRDAGGVLTRDFKVHGTQGLRVVDASVFPRIPGFFIVCAIYMIAEKAADDILAAARGAKP